MLRKDGKYKWEKVEHEAFTYVKNLLMNKPILGLPRFDLEFIVTTDASALGFGAALTQVHEDKKERVVTYGSHKSTKDEEKIGTYDLELIAILYALNI